MDEALKFAIESGMINLSYVQEKYEMNKREELLKKHPYSIWKGNDGNWHTYLPSETGGRVPKKRKKEEDIHKIVIDYWREKEENPTIKEVFTEWNNRKLELKKISDATHLRNKQFFNRHYKEFGGRKIKSISPEEIEDFLEVQVSEYDLTAKAFSGLKGITRGFLKRAKKCKMISFNVEELFQELDTSESDFKKVIKEDYEEVFSEDEMPVIMEYLENNQDMVNVGIMLMFLTGIRVGELVALKHEDFNDNTFKIRRTETRYRDENGKYIYAVKNYPKTQAGIRTVIVPESYMWLVEKIKRINPFGEYIFLKRDKRITTQSVRMRLARICKKLNIYHKSPHKIRKTYGTILLDNHVDNKLIIGQMGHTDILCTENHYHRNRKSVNKKSQIISSLPEFQSMAK